MLEAGLSKKENNAIEVKGISKYYRLGAKEEQKNSIVSSIIAAIKSPIKSPIKKINQSKKN